MKIGFVTNLRAPYRTLQLNEFSKINNVNITTYYCNDKTRNRKWKTGDKIEFDEIDLEGIKIFNKYGYINKGILNIVKNNDLILIGGYEQPTYILISMLCRLLKKPYILVFDGISTNRLSEKENFIKKYLKSIVISNSKYIMGNGTVSKRYFNEVFKYPSEKIYNQYLTVDSDKINMLYKNKDRYRREYREKLNIKETDKVLIYSGRLVDIKNVQSVIKAIAKIERNDITFLITGGGILESELKFLSKSLGVRTIITGFISEQEELFKHYFVGDALILPSTYEPWGLVVNEAMFSGLPVIVSNVCGCSIDLVNKGGNGQIINPKDINDIKEKIEFVINNLISQGKNNSREIIKEYTFENSRKVLEDIIKNIK